MLWNYIISRAGLLAEYADAAFHRRRTFLTNPDHPPPPQVFTGTASSGMARGDEVTEAERRIASIKPVVGGLIFGPCRRPIGTTTVDLEETGLAFGRYGNYDIIFGAFL